MCQKERPTPCFITQRRTCSFFGGYDFTTLYLPKTRVPMQPHPPYAHDRHTVIHQNAPDALLHRTTSGALFLEIRLQRSAFAQKPACRCKPLCRPLSLVILPYTKRASEATLYHAAPGAFIFEAWTSHSSFVQEPVRRCKPLCRPLDPFHCHIPKVRPTHASSHSVGRVHFWITLTASHSSKTLPSRCRRATGSARLRPATSPR